MNRRAGGLWASLVAAATLLGQVLAGFGAIANADLAQVFNPAVWFGFNNIAGTGGLLDSLVGGAGAPGGTVNRYVAFMLMAFIAVICYTAIKAAWTWASVKTASPLSETGVQVNPLSGGRGTTSSPQSRHCTRSTSSSDGSTPA